MVLELHVWGPAFGLPSIEPECIATVAYCQRVIPQGQWSLVADYDTTVGTTGCLPILLDDGIATASGFEDIVAYLRNYPGISGDLDADLLPRHGTDRTAMISFLHSIATPLVDLLLYVSAENYNTATSSAYTAILPWYANYTIPPKRRDLARARTAHMGLSSLDVDATAEEGFAPGRGTASADYEAAKRAAGIPTDKQPNTLKIGRGKGLGGLLGTPIYAARFRLDAISNELLEPLADLLGNKQYLFAGNQPTSLDCLAFGFLSLLYYPTLPQSWLKDTIDARFPKVAAYIGRLREDLFSNETIDSATVWSISTGDVSKQDQNLLPWHSRSSTFTSRTWSGTREILGNLPLISSWTQRKAITHCESALVSKRFQSSLPSVLLVNSLLGLTAAVAVGLTSLAVHHRRSPRDGPLIFWALRPQTGFGEAENLLSVLAGQLPSGGSISPF